MYLLRRVGKRPKKNAFDFKMADDRLRRSNDTGQAKRPQFNRSRTPTALTFWWILILITQFAFNEIIAMGLKKLAFNKKNPRDNTNNKKIWKKKEFIFF